MNFELYNFFSKCQDRLGHDSTLYFLTCRPLFDILRIDFQLPIILLFILGESNG